MRCWCFGSYWSLAYKKILSLWGWRFIGLSNVFVFCGPEPPLVFYVVVRKIQIVWDMFFLFFCDIIKVNNYTNFSFLCFLSIMLCTLFQHWYHMDMRQLHHTFGFFCHLLYSIQSCWLSLWIHDALRYQTFALFSILPYYLPDLFSSLWI